MMAEKNQILRLVLGDQLNSNHSWYNIVQENVCYILMEIKAESEYVKHHIQKITGIFSAMRNFADMLKSKGHRVFYFKISDTKNEHRFEENLNYLIDLFNCSVFEYQEPDEYRLDLLLRSYCQKISIDSQVCSSEHFYTTRTELMEFFSSKKSIIMETFYRFMRKKHKVLIDSKGKPEGSKWNFDKSNRKKLPKKHIPPLPFVKHHHVQQIYDEIIDAGINYIGKINPEAFIWPVSREESLEMMDDFIERLLPDFGSYQDAMHRDYWSVYHSRLSFALNIKMISPQEIVNRVEEAFYKNKCEISQAEGFIRQILGWREFMRGIYWKEMPAYENKNYFNATRKLPEFFWTGNTKMQCLKKSIDQSMDFAYAHHIQRLMVIGNFCLMAGIDPDEVDEWYLGIYIDAFQWVEITNTRGMSQFADGGIVATKPYCSSANYIDKMSDYCSSCYYNKKEKTGDRACPYNSLYWNFIHKHKDELANNQRMSMMYRIWDKYTEDEKQLIINQASGLLEKINEL